MTNKAKLRNYIDNNPRKWLFTRAADIANDTGISRQYVHDMICVVAAQKFADKMPSEYKEMRRTALKDQSKSSRIKTMLRRNNSIEDIVLTVGTTVDYVRRLKKQVRDEEIEAMLRKGESMTKIASAAEVSVNYVRRVIRNMKRDGQTLFRPV